MAIHYTHNILSDLQMFFHQAGSCQMEGITALYNYIMSFLTGILCVVTSALVIIIFFHLHGRRHIYQYKMEKNLDLLIEWLKYIQKWTHSTTLELVWTIIPTTILIAIAIPSFILLYSLDEIVDTQTVIKVIAFQWYWKYEYPVISPYSEDTVNFSYLSYMIPTEDLTEENSLRLLEVDMPLVVPINVNVKFIITSKDVIHSFAIPALGIKMDAVPGRLNQVTVHIYKPGIYFGQCSELCGVNHAFMPIALHAVDFNTFEEFLLKGVELTEKFEDGSSVWDFMEMVRQAIKEIEEEDRLKEAEEKLKMEQEKEESVAYGPYEGPYDFIDDPAHPRYISDAKIIQYLAMLEAMEKEPENFPLMYKCHIDPETGEKIIRPVRQECHVDPVTGEKTCVPVICHVDPETGKEVCVPIEAEFASETETSASYYAPTGEKVDCLKCIEEAKNSIKKNDN